MILHDNSAEVMRRKCERLYQLSVIHGISRPANSYSQFGSMFHRGVQLMINGNLEPMDTLIALSLDYPELGSDENLVGRMQRLITQFHSSFQRGKNPHAEQKLLYLYPRSRIGLCGTVDYRDVYEGYLRIIDFKTGWDPDSGRILAKYDMSSQLPFYNYLISKLKDQILSEEELDLFNQNKVGFHYCICNATSFDIRMSSVKQIHAEEAKLMADLIDHSVEAVEERWATAEANPTIVFPKTGMFTGICNGDGKYPCAFNHVCRKFDSYEENIALLDMERGTYDPTSFR